MISKEDLEKLHEARGILYDFGNKEIDEELFQRVVNVYYALESIIGEIE